MVKNNIKTFFLYSIIILITFLLLNGLMILENNTSLSMNNSIIKFIIIIFYILLFFIVGKIIGKKTNFISDFSSFILVFSIGLMLFFLGILAGGINLEQITNVATLPALVFLSPLILISIILNLSFNLLTFSILSGYVNLIIGFGIQFNKNHK